MTVRGLSNRMDRSQFRLYCLPWAGAAASAYWKWESLFGPPFGVIPVELPGRGARRAERLFERFDEAIQAALSQIVQELSPPYALFGHSLGALIAFELVNLIRDTRHPGPDALIVSGCAAPQIRRSPKPRSRLPRDEFIEALRGLAGTSQEIMESEELMDLLLPAMRADFHLAETYVYCPSELLDCPVLALAGGEDPEVRMDEAAEWRSLTKRSFAFEALPGGHFFIETAREAVVSCISAWLNTVSPFLALRGEHARAAL